MTDPATPDQLSRLADLESTSPHHAAFSRAHRTNCRFGKEITAAQARELIERLERYGADYRGQ